MGQGTGEKFGFNCGIPKPILQPDRNGRVDNGFNGKKFVVFIGAEFIDGAGILTPMPWENSYFSHNNLQSDIFTLLPQFIHLPYFGAGFVCRELTCSLIPSQEHI